MNHLADVMDPEQVELLSFSYRTALMGRWDILHVHWPEGLLRAQSRRNKMLRTAQFLALVLRIRLGRKPVLRTVHNLNPHESGHSLEPRLLALLDSTVDVFVALNPYTEIPGGAVAAMVPHGEYRHLVSNSPLPPCEPGQTFNLLFFGFLKPYKGVESLLEVFEALPDDRLRLHISGRATPALERLVTETADQDRRISLCLDFADDQQLDRELSRAHLVVLPYPVVHNSGAMIHALSAGRPVLVVRNKVTSWIADECGPGWVHFFDAPLKEKELRSALDAAQRNPPSAPPAFVNRTWQYGARQYEALYRTALSR